MTAHPPSSSQDDKNILLRLARSPDEIWAAQRLRYNVFYEEFGATPDELTAQEKRDFDPYDEIADHLIVIDQSRSSELGQIVGTYRLIRQEKLTQDLPFYSSHEFDISPLLDSTENLLELGRSCVLPAYRTKAVMQMLWQGIADYLSEHQLGIMFGCASIQGTDPESVADQLSYLYHYHLAPPDLCPAALPTNAVNMNRIPKDKIDARRVFSNLPPLVKGYLRLGAYIGAGASIDQQFNSIDVCIVLPTAKVTSKYMKHYERKIQKPLVSKQPPASSLTDNNSV